VRGAGIGQGHGHVVGGRDLIEHAQVAPDGPGRQTFQDLLAIEDVHAPPKLTG
jgi:hypothetical protein